MNRLWVRAGGLESGSAQPRKPAECQKQAKEILAKPTGNSSEKSVTIHL